MLWRGGRRETMWRVWPLLVAVSLISLETVKALTLQQREIPAVVALDIKRNDVLDPMARDRARRKRNTATVNQALDNEVYGHALQFGSRHGC